MRTLLFRAWDKKDKQFVFFELFQGVNKHTPPIYEWADLEEWQQYTGLRDKHDNPIFEGDIIKDSFNHWDKREVEMDMYFWWDFVEYTLMDAELEVIGNIYENPELEKT